MPHRPELLDDGPSDEPGRASYENTHSRFFPSLAARPEKHVLVLPRQLQACTGCRCQRLGRQQPVYGVTLPRHPDRAVTAEDDIAFAIPCNEIGKDLVENVSVNDKNGQYLTRERQWVKPGAQVPDTDIADRSRGVKGGEWLRAFIVDRFAAAAVVLRVPE